MKRVARVAGAVCSCLVLGMSAANASELLLTDHELDRVTAGALFTQPAGFGPNPVSFDGPLAPPPPPAPPPPAPNPTPSVPVLVSQNADGASASINMPDLATGATGAFNVTAGGGNGTKSAGAVLQIQSPGASSSRGLSTIIGG